VLEFSSIEAIKQCVIADMSLAVLPAVTVARELEQGHLVQLAWAGPSLDVVTKLVRHAERWCSPALAAFLELAQANLGD
jgi:DNA-binding transcriptional LysR family regulator